MTSTSCFRIRRLQPKVPRKWQEVPIRVEQRQPVLNAPISYESSDGLAYGDADRSQRSVVPGGFDRKVVTGEILDVGAHLVYLVDIRYTW